MEPFEFVDPELFGTLELDPGLSVFLPENPDREMLYTGLRCPCGGVQFGLSGRLSIASGRGGFFWRTFLRFLREARQPMRVEECSESPIKPPLCMRCANCERVFSVLDDAPMQAAQPICQGEEPEEALRCRVCRRGRFELLAGVARDELRAAPSEIEILSRCHSCHRQTRIAWAKSGVSEQEMKLDLLYGRR